MRYLLVCMLMLFGGMCASCGPAGPSSPHGWESKKLAKLSEVRHYELTMAGRGIGSASGRFIEQPNGSRRFELELQMRIERVVQGKLTETKMISTERVTYSADMSLQQHRSELSTDGVLSAHEFLIGEGELILLPAEGSDADPEKFPLPANFGDERTASASLLSRVQQGETPNPIELQAFSTRHKKFVPLTASYLGQRNLKVGDTEIVGHEFAIDLDGRKSSVVFDQELMYLSSTIGGAIKLERVAEPVSPVVKARENSVIPANRTIRDFRAVTSMELMITVEDDERHESPLFESGLYHEVKRHSGGYRLSTFQTPSPKQETEAAPYPLQDIPAEVQPYLKATAVCDSEHPLIVAKSKELMAETKQKQELLDRSDCSMNCATALMFWVWRNIKAVEDSGERASASAVLSAGTGSIEEQTHLLVALARASGLPARTASGYTYAVLDGKGVWAATRWAEIWVGRWAAFSIAQVGHGMTGRFIYTGYLDPPSSQRNVNALRAASIQSIRILSVSPEGIE